MAKRSQARASIGAVLRQWRLESEFTQRDAARAVGVSQSTWCKWERDEMMPGADDLNRIVAAAEGALTGDALVDAARPVRQAG